MKMNSKYKGVGEGRKIQKASRKTQNSRKKGIF